MIEKLSCGVLPMFGRGDLKTPYPAALYTVQPGVLLLDYALQQFVHSGIKRVYIPVATKDMEWFSRYVGYERHGLSLVYIEVPTKFAGDFYQFVSRGSVAGERRADYTRYYVLNPHVRIEDPYWLSRIVGEHSESFHLGVTDCYYLRHASATALRTALRLERSGEECLAAEFNGRYLQTPNHLDLGTWAGIQAFHLAYPVSDA